MFSQTKKFVLLATAVIFSISAVSRPAAATGAEFLRLTSPYKRAYAACSSANDLSRLVYLRASLQQASEWLSLNPQNIKSELHREYHVSQILERDLRDPGFELALNDCGLDESGKKRFVVEILALDIFGKMLVLSGTASLTRVSLGLTKKLAKLFPKSFMIVSVGGLAATAYKSFKKSSPSQARVDTAGNQTETTLEALNERLSLESYHQNLAKLRAEVIAMLDREIEELNSALQNTEDPQEKARLAKQLEIARRNRASL